MTEGKIKTTWNIYSCDWVDYNMLWINICYESYYVDKVSYITLFCLCPFLYLKQKGNIGSNHFLETYLDPTIFLISRNLRK